MSTRPRKSGKQRVATRDLVRIGQVWERRRDKQWIRIQQIHRPDRLVDIVVEAPGPLAGQKGRIKFTDLRSKYQLLAGRARPEGNQ